MSKKILFLTAVVSVFSACQLQAAVINSNWVGGSQGEWGNANNWSPAIVPDNDGGNTFVVTIDSNSIGGGDVVVFLSSDYTINQLDCNGTVELGKVGFDRIELVLNPNGLTNYGELGIWREGSQMVIDGNVTNYGSMEFECDINGDVVNKSGATLDFWDHLNIYGNLYNEAGATLLFGNEDADVEGDGEGVSKIVNDGTIICYSGGGPGEMDLFENRGSIQLFGGTCSAEVIFDNNSTGDIRGFGVLASGQLLRNKGQIIAFGGSLAVGIEGALINTGVLGNHPVASLHIKPSLHTEPAADVNNQGIIEVNAGGGVAFDCNLVNDTNGVIELRGGTLAATTITQTADANFAGFGGITGDVIIDPNGLIELTGPTNIIGDVNIPAGATLKISDGQTLITGHTICDGTIHLIGGTVVFQGGCDCDDCNIINEAGLDRNHFDINADGIVNLRDFAGLANTWLWQATWY